MRPSGRFCSRRRPCRRRGLPDRRLMRWLPINDSVVASIGREQHVRSGQHVLLSGQLALAAFGPPRSCRSVLSGRDAVAALAAPFRRWSSSPSEGPGPDEADIRLQPVSRGPKVQPAAQAEVSGQAFFEQARAGAAAIGLGCAAQASLIFDAFNMDVDGRQPKCVAQHSDRGRQYTSFAFGQRCAELGVRPSTGSVSDAYYNAMAAAFLAALGCELLDRHRFRSQVEARMAVFHFIEGFYSPGRRHSGTGFLSPSNFERIKMPADS